jgi:dihydropteroate synthase
MDKLCNCLGDIKIPRIMGILNVTEDSFSDGGRFLDLDAALNQAEKLIAEGADILDIGGESTRPGSQPVPVEMELERVVPVVREIWSKWPKIPISVDTRKSEVAQAAIELGASIINDISALRYDPGMAPVLAAHPGVKVVLMHMQGEPKTMQDDPRYEDLLAEINGFFKERIAFAQAAGIARERIVLDPGIGFGKMAGHNLKLLNSLEVFREHGLPLLIGASRKRFIAAVDPTQPDERIGGSLAAALASALQGVEYIRVHDVRAHRQFFQILIAIAGERY